MKSHLSNIDFIKYLMEYSPQGAMSQIFIIAAIEKYATMVINAKEHDWPVGHLIDFKSWQDTARYLKKEINNRGN